MPAAQPQSAEVPAAAARPMSRRRPNGTVLQQYPAAASGATVAAESHCRAGMVSVPLTVGC